jgi:hypothetical protein
MTSQFPNFLFFGRGGAMVKQCNRMLEEEGNTLFKKKMFDYKVLRNAVKNTLISG